MDILRPLMTAVKRSRRCRWVILGLIIFTGLIIAVNAAFAVEAVTTTLAAAANKTITSVVNLVLGSILSLIAYIVSLFLSKAVSVLVVVAQYQDFLIEAPVLVGWQAVRDICYMFFVVVMLLIAFGTMLNVEAYNYKKLLPKMILMAILVTFSKSIAGLFIDIATVAMMGFVYSFASIAGTDLMGKLGVFNMFSKTSSSPSALMSGTSIDDSSQQLTLAESIGSMILGIILLIVALGTVVIMAFTLVYRIVMIWILVILSPGAYLLSVFPGGQKYAEQWWDHFTRYLLVGPMMAFFMWLSLATLDDVKYDSKAAEVGFGSSGGIPSVSEAGKTENLYRFVVAIALLLGGLGVTQQLGVGGGKMAGSFVGKLAAFGTGAVLGGLAVAKWAGKGAYEETSAQLGVPTWDNIKEGWAKGVKKRADKRKSLHHTRAETIASVMARKSGGFSDEIDESMKARYESAATADDLFVNYGSVKGIGKFLLGSGFRLGKGGIGERGAAAREEAAKKKKDDAEGVNKNLQENDLTRGVVEEKEKLIEENTEKIKIEKKDLLTMDQEISKEEAGRAGKVEGVRALAEEERTALFKDEASNLTGTDKTAADKALNDRETALVDLAAAIKAKDDTAKQQAEIDLDLANNNFDNAVLVGNPIGMVDFMNKENKIDQREKDRVQVIDNDLQEKKDARAEKAEGINELEKDKQEALNLVKTKEERENFTPDEWKGLHGKARQIHEDKRDKALNDAQSLQDEIDKGKDGNISNPGNITPDNKIIQEMKTKELERLTKQMVAYQRAIAQKKDKQDLLTTKQGLSAGDEEFDALTREITDLESKMTSVNTDRAALKADHFTVDFAKAVDGAHFVEDLKKEAEKIQKILDAPVATIEEIEAAQKAYFEAKKEHDQALREYKMVRAPINYEARRHHRHEVEDARKNITTDNADELVSIVQSAVGRKDSGEAGAAMLRLAETANLNELLNGFGYGSDALGLQKFTKEILIDQLGMAHEQAMMVANDASYKAEGVNHWMDARAVDIDRHGNYTWKDEGARQKEIAAEVAKMDPGMVIKKFNRLAYGTESIDEKTGEKKFELSDFGAYLIGQFGGTPVPGQAKNTIDRGIDRNEFVRNAAFNINVPTARQKIMTGVEMEYGKDSLEARQIRKTLKNIENYVKGGTKENQFRQLDRLIKSSNKKKE